MLDELMGQMTAQTTDLMTEQMMDELMGHPKVVRGLVHHLD